MKADAVLNVGSTRPLGQLVPSKRIFIRQFYFAAFKSIWYRLNISEPERLYITGTPGIGKSLFGLLFLVELVRFLKAAGASPDQLAPFGMGLSGHIVYEYVKTEGDPPQFYLIDTASNSIVKFHDHDIASEWTDDPHTFLIKDGPCREYPTHCSVLWISSPRSASFDKSQSTELELKTYIFQPWTDDELIDCVRCNCAPKELLEPYVPSAEVDGPAGGGKAFKMIVMPEEAALAPVSFGAETAAQEAIVALDEESSPEERRTAIIRRWSADLGPVPRRVFGPIPGYVQLQAALNDLGNADLDELESYATRSDAAIIGGSNKFKHSHRLLLMAPNNGALTYELIPASVRIGRRILMKKFMNDIRAAQSLMGKVMGTHLGLVFEPYAHFVLAQEHTYIIHNLASGEPEEFKTDQCATVDIDNKTVLDRQLPVFEEKKYYIPTDPTFAVVDSWTKQAMFQVTVSLSHPIKSASKQFLALRRADGPQRIIFVVPKEKAKDFKHQPCVKSDGTGLNPQGGWNGVRQYVLGL